MTGIASLRAAITAGAAAALALAPLPAMARSEVSDLVGARASSGEEQLTTRGFVHITGSKDANGTLNHYWWHAGDRKCVRVETWDGRYTAITGASAQDCHQRGGGNAAAAVGVVAGAALIAALASHKSHHHDNDQHYASNADEEQYERGFNDGLYKNDYHNYDRSDAYATGYTAGVEQRRANTGYHAGGSGYRPAVRIADMKGMDAVSAIDEIRNRGFASVDSFSSGNTLYGIYFNRRTGQCVQMTNADSRVYDIRDIGSHPKCR